MNEEPETAMCFHNFVGKAPIDPRCHDCVCKKRGFCIANCLCTESCELKREGCKCKDSCETEKCICFQNDIECEPGLCQGCFNKAHDLKKNSCTNDQILRKSSKKTVIGLSHIPGAGLGCFTNENLRKNDLILIYSG